MPLQRPDTRERRAQLVEDAQRIVLAEYPSDLSLDDVARRIATSRRQLQRAYQEVGATSFRSALARVRVEAAAELLVSDGLPVREVAHRVGYRQPAQFAKAFRRLTGEAPAVWRAQRRAAEAPSVASASATQDGRPAPAPPSRG